MVGMMCWPQPRTPTGQALLRMAARHRKSLSSLHVALISSCHRTQISVRTFSQPALQRPFEWPCDGALLSASSQTSPAVFYNSQCLKFSVLNKAYIDYSIVATLAAVQRLAQCTHMVPTATMESLSRKAVGSAGMLSPIA